MAAIEGEESPERLARGGRVATPDGGPRVRDRLLDVRLGRQRSVEHVLRLRARRIDRQGFLRVSDGVVVGLVVEVGAGQLDLAREEGLGEDALLLRGGGRGRRGRRPRAGVHVAADAGRHEHRDGGAGDEGPPRRGGRYVGELGGHGGVLSRRDAQRPPQDARPSPRVEGGRTLGRVPDHGVARVLEDRGIGAGGGADDRLARERLLGRRERPAHLRGVGEARGGVAGQRALDHGADALRRLGGLRAQGRGVALDDRLQHLRHGPAVEGPRARDHLVADGAEREDVGARVGPLPADLLRRHVVGGPHHRARLRHLRRGEAGEAEIEDLHLAGRLDVDVRRLEVAVDDAAGVGEAEPVAQLHHQVEPPQQRTEGAAPYRLAEVQALHELHRHVGESGLVVPEVVDRDDVRVVELGGGLRLALEALAELRVGGERRRDGLDRDEAVEERVVRLEDLAHRTLADPFDDPVLADAVQVHHDHPPGPSPGAERQRTCVRIQMGRMRES